MHLLKDFFLMWAIFIVFIQSVTILLLLDVWLPSMWDLGSLTRD